jgi:small subunit ribosomal protein S19e
MIDKVEPRILIKNISEKLKSVIDMPEWAKFVKTGVSKQRPPINDDWWFVRAASILRTIDNKGPIGVAKLRSKYGSKKNNGVAPDHFRKASGKIIRTILQQLEKAQLLKQEAKGVHKGRITTDEGKKLLYGTSKALASMKPAKKIVEVKKEVPKLVEKKTKSEVEVKKEVPKLVEKKTKPEVEVKKEVPKLVEKKTKSEVEVKKEVPKIETKKEEPKVVKKQPEIKPEIKEETPSIIEKKEAPKAEAPKKVE